MARSFGFSRPNGSGKTTFSGCFGASLTPTKAPAVLGTTCRSATAAIKREVGYMTQRFSFYEDLTIQEKFSSSSHIYAVQDRAHRPPQSRRTRAAGPPPTAPPAAGSSGSPSRPASSTTRNSCSSTSSKCGRDFSRTIHRLASTTVSPSDHHPWTRRNAVIGSACVAYGQLVTHGA